MEQIKPTELRIGNYYIGASRGGYEIATGRMIAQLEERKLNALPIPLTEEVLRAAGFTYENIGWNDFYLKGTWHKGAFFINDYADGTFGHPWGEQGDVFDVLHLHQLQNLYFALTGQELEVSLPLIGNSPIRDNK